MTPANVTTFSYPSLTQTTVTDPLGKVTTIAYNSQGQPTSLTDPLSHTTTFEYDAVGNLTATVDALSHRTERTYDAVSRLVGLKDPRGFVTVFRYDDANHVRQILDARNGQTQFSYDLNGNLLTVTDAKNQRTTYTYDSMDRLATRKDALNRTESYQYDLAGNLTQLTDRKNQTSTFTYDAWNRRIGATYPDATVTFGYDAINRLTSVDDSVGSTITWTYDTVSGGHHPRVLETTTPGTVTVEYDEIGRRVKLSATGLTDTTYSYDQNSRLTGVTQGSQTVALTYDDAGRRISLTYPNGVVTSYGYDNANRLLTINHVKTPTTIEALTYQYDGSSNRISLTRANAAASLIPTAVSSNTYDAANEQTQFNGVTQTFDANGNLTNDGTNAYTWDARNRLTGISGGVAASFVYDGLGRRKSKSIGGATTGFWYDSVDVLAELSGSTPTVTYVRSLSIDEPLIRKQSGGDEFYQTDVLGTTVTLTNSAGVSANTYTNEPFGKTAKIGSSTNPFQFTGRENDEAGLYYYRARYYSPKLRGFLSEDPIRFKGGDVNLYSYAFTDPISLRDPFGLLGIEDIYDADVTGQALAAFVDGIVPFWDPFAEYGFYNTCNALLIYNGALGSLVRDLELFIILRSGAGYPNGWLFGRGINGGTKGILNRGPLRVGWGWFDPKIGGYGEVFRVALGSGRGHLHPLNLAREAAEKIGYLFAGLGIIGDAGGTYTKNKCGCNR